MSIRPFLLTLAAALTLSHAAKLKDRLPSPDYAGTFIDACKFQFDSIQVDQDSLRLTFGSAPESHAWTGRSDDTVFYGQTWALVRIKAKGKPAYLFSLWPEKPPARWNEVVYYQLIPKTAYNNRKTYDAAEIGPGQAGCREGKPSADPPRMDKAVRAQELMKIMLRDFDISMLTVGDLYRVKGKEKRLSELEIDWRELPKLTQRLNDEDLDEKLRGDSGRNKVFVKDFERIGLSHGLTFIPLSWKDVEFMELTAKEIEALGATAGYTEDDPPYLH